MSYLATVFRILIASPSDVDEERDIASRVIQEWNDLNSKEQEIVLLPLRWETHASPEYLENPQKTINRQVADSCDIVIGIFWTRIGTQTETAESGSIEEIERASKAKKPVMLYFSQVKQNPEDINIEQLSTLRKFRQTTEKISLVETYVSQMDFKEKLTRQLAIKIREQSVLIEKSDGAQSSKKLGADIVLCFAQNSSNTSDGTSIRRSTKYIAIQNLEDVIDYDNPELEMPENSSQETPWGQFKRINKDYYRQVVEFNVINTFFTPIKFWLKNLGSIGARDIHIQLEIKASFDGISVITPLQMPTFPPSPIDSGMLMSSSTQIKTVSQIMKQEANTWTAEFYIPALQPQREITTPIQILVGAIRSCTIKVNATIFADTLSMPSNQEMIIDMEVSSSDLDPRKLVYPIQLIQSIVPQELTFNNPYRSYSGV